MSSMTTVEGAVNALVWQAAEWANKTELVLPEGKALSLCGKTFRTLATDKSF